MITRAITLSTGNTETRPISVICCKFTEWSERNHSTKALKGSSKNALLDKIEAIDHTLALLSSFALQMLQKSVGDCKTALHCVQRILLAKIRLFTGDVNFILCIAPSSKLYNSVGVGTSPRPYEVPAGKAALYTVGNITTACIHRATSQPRLKPINPPKCAPNAAKPNSSTLPTVAMGSAVCAILR